MTNKISSLTRNALLVICSLFFVGCPAQAPEKPTDPDEVEKIRKEHEDMSHREMQNEG